MHKDDWWNLLNVGMLAAVLWKMDDVKKEVVHFEKMHGLYHGYRAFPTRKQYEKDLKREYGS